MGATLMGGEKSGTPLETRAGTSQLASMFQELMKQKDPFGRMTTESMVNMLGFDPSAMGLNEAITSALVDPADQTAGLFASLVPFEQRQVNQGTADLRSMFSTMGGRFGRNIATAEGQFRGDAAAGFQRNRQDALLQANQQRNNLIPALGQLATAARSQAFTEQMAPLEMFARFFQPGEPIITEGILPGLLSTAGTIAGMKMMGGGLPTRAGGAAPPTSAPWGTGPLPRWTPPSWNPSLLSAGGRR